MYDERNKIIRKLNKLKYKLEDKEDIKLIDEAIELMKKQKDKILELDKEVENTINKISKSSSDNERLIEKLFSGEVFTPNQLDFIKENYILKQTIKGKIKNLKYKKNTRIQLGIFILKDYENQHLLGEISSLEELLEESEDR